MMITRQDGDNHYLSHTGSDLKRHPPSLKPDRSGDAPVAVMIMITRLAGTSHFVILEGKVPTQKKKKLRITKKFEIFQQYENSSQGKISCEGSGWKTP